MIRPHVHLRGTAGMLDRLVAAAGRSMLFGRVLLGELVLGHAPGYPRFAGDTRRGEHHELVTIKSV